jgi:hypothetical protein
MGEAGVFLQRERPPQGYVDRNCCLTNGCVPIVLKDVVRGKAREGGRSGDFFCVLAERKCLDYCPKNVGDCDYREGGMRNEWLTVGERGSFC